MAENGELAEEYHPQHTPSSSPHSSPQHSKCSINLTLLPIKGYYFVFMSAVGVLLPFIALFMHQLGLTYHEMGIIYGIMPFVGFFMRPVIGAVADKYKKHKFVLMSVTLLTGLFYFFLVFVPERVVPEKVSIHTTFECNTQDSFFQDCHDINAAKGCRTTIGLTQFANSTNYNNFSEPLACTVTCQTQEDAPLPKFKSCFTNDTGPYDTDRCNGTLSHSRHLKFVVPSLERLILSEIPRDRYQVDSLQCLDYDIKDILCEQGHTHEAWQILCERELTLECNVDCSQKSTCPEKVEEFDTTFVVFFLIFLVANICFAPIFPILDAAAYNILKEDRHKWGKQRVWGTLGFALFAVTATFVMYIISKNEQDVNYVVSFYLFLPLCIGAAIIAYFMQVSSDIKCGQFVKNVWILLSNMKILTFLLVVMYFGMLTGGQEAFLFLYLGGLGSSPLVFGFILLANCTSEIPMLWVAGFFIKKLSLISCLYLALICYGIRMVVYSFLINPWFVLMVEPLHGVCFSLMYAAASSYASIIAPPGMSATVQGLLGGVHFGFGKGLGSLITGFLFKGLGPRWTWRTYAIVSGILLVVYFSLNRFVFKAETKAGACRQTDVTDKPETKQEVKLINPNQQDTEDGVETMA